MGEGEARSRYGFAIVRTGLLQLPEVRGAEPLETPGLQKDTGLLASSDASASPLSCHRCPLVLSRTQAAKLSPQHLSTTHKKRLLPSAINEIRKRFVSIEL